MEHAQSLFSSTTTGIISNLANVGLLWLGSFFVISGALSIGQLIAFNGMSGNFLGFLGTAIALVDDFVTAQMVIQRLSEVLDATAEEDPNQEKPWAKIPADADISCSHLTFHHAGRDDLLKEFSLTVSV